MLRGQARLFKDAGEDENQKAHKKCCVYKYIHVGQSLDERFCGNRMLKCVFCGHEFQGNQFVASRHFRQGKGCPEVTDDALVDIHYNSDYKMSDKLLERIKRFEELHGPTPGMDLRRDEGGEGEIRDAGEQIDVDGDVEEVARAWSSGRERGKGVVRESWGQQCQYFASAHVSVRTRAGVDTAEEDPSTGKRKEREEGARPTAAQKRLRQNTITESFSSKWQMEFKKRWLRFVYSERLAFNVFRSDPHDFHVMTRIGNIPGILPIFWNSINIPVVPQGWGFDELAHEFLRLNNLCRSAVQIDREVVLACWNLPAGAAYAPDPVLIRWVRRLLAYACVPIDRNTADTLVLCPRLYVHFLRMTFEWNRSFFPVDVESAVVLAGMKEAFTDAHLDRIGKRNPQGDFGHAVVLPKHKDLSRWRPISPTFSEPAKLASSRVARALNCLLFALPASSNFNLKAVDCFKDGLARMSRAVSSLGNVMDMESASFDIKDMFISLPQVNILQAIEWLVDIYLNRGCVGVTVAKRGRNAYLSFGTNREGYVLIGLWQNLDMVAFDLRCTYVWSVDVLLRQVIGVPMGKSTSCPLTCILCARAEHKFVTGLGTDRKLVFGFRIVDDVSIFIARRLRDGEEKARMILVAFLRCYGENLRLVRTDTAGGSGWGFAGTQAQRIGAEISTVAIVKNAEPILKHRRLVFGSFQDFCSYGSKKAKIAAILGTLSRIHRWSSDGRMQVFLSIRSELLLRDYPPKLIDSVFQRFAVNADSPEAVVVLALGVGPAH
ncbi:hypothetical protein CBR_g31941 [Chara braunii]|uniref:Reverse transcriptase domain-containing protein n=1 Tax=Chara braunii TaxID=69332 RepID=A0A388LG42_CHABU|nr:hypothetical protein CBR_g31941 [Chara braunii]|eukprot:GBG81269.1 hypothetical protein CBR_g31941 [Chara braunii]